MTDSTCDPVEVVAAAIREVADTKDRDDYWGVLARAVIAALADLGDITDESLARTLYTAANALDLASDSPCSTWDDILAQGPEFAYEETMRQVYAVRALIAQARAVDQAEIERLRAEVTNESIDNHRLLDEDDSDGINPLDQVGVLRHRTEAQRQETERLWAEAERLGAVNDRLRTSTQTAEAERDALRSQVERVRALIEAQPGMEDGMIDTRLVRLALDENEPR